MAHAEKCPICGGSGKYCTKYKMQYIQGKMAFNRQEEVCHGCYGTGWIVVNDGQCIEPERVSWETSAQHCL